jgi:DNA polymerase-3 subunit epsilon
MGSSPRKKRTKLLTIGAALRLESTRIDSAVTPGALTSAEEPRGAAFRLAAGDLIVLTGEMRRQRSQWEGHLEALGYRTAGNVSKKTALVAAANAETLSGKAKRAHELGIPVVSESKLADLVGSWPTH